MVRPSSEISWLEDCIEESSDVDDDGDRLSDDDIVSLCESSQRRQHGLYLTPRDVALGLATGLDIAGGEHVVDLAAGTGRLLAAAIEVAPHCRVTGIERSPELAVVAAVEVLRARLLQDESPDVDEIRVANGLEHPGRQGADVVMLNPPYGGEKGRAKTFREIRSRWPDLDERCGGRYDLAYFFVHRALDWLSRGGRLGAITTEYWLYATGAAPLRREVTERTQPIWMVRGGGATMFEDAPGQHSIVFRLDATDQNERPSSADITALEVTGDVDWRELLEACAPASRAGEGLPDGVVRADGEWRGGSAPWRPFTSRSDRRWAERLEETCGRLGDLAIDRQGIVSGADRVSGRRMAAMRRDHGGEPDDLETGDPGFLWDRDELTPRLERLRGTVLRPVVRGSELEAGEVIVEPPDDTFILYIDGTLPDDEVDEIVGHLLELEPDLADRREVRRGTMPWYRLHWPRRRAEQVAPKLVVPRRAHHPRFALDLSASAVSSDCTYLCAPEWVADPIEHLCRLMHILNSPTIARYLEIAGKKKGEVIEFYAEPLRRLPVPLHRDENSPEWLNDPGAFHRSRIEPDVEETLCCFLS